MSTELRELDAEVAVRVLGWRYVRQMDLRTKQEVGWLYEPEEAAMRLAEYVSETHPRPRYRDTMPHFSSDIAAAGSSDEKTSRAYELHCEWSRQFRYRHPRDVLRSIAPDYDFFACWCPITKPCHADILLELANR